MFTKLSGKKMKVEIDTLLDNGMSCTQIHKIICYNMKLT